MPNLELNLASPERFWCCVFMQKKAGEVVCRVEKAVFEAPSNTQFQVCIGLRLVLVFKSAGQAKEFRPFSTTTLTGTTGPRSLCKF